MSLSPPPLSQPRDTVSQPMHIIRCILECKAMTCIETCYKDTYSEDDKDGSHDDTFSVIPELEVFNSIRKTLCKIITASDSNT